MRRWLVPLAGLFAVLAAVAGWQSLAAQEAPRPDPNSLLPTNTLVYVALHGGPEVQAAWEKTAAHKAIVQSGLSDAVYALLAAAMPAIGQAAEIPPEALEYYAFAEELLAHVAEHGLVFGADVRLVAGEILLVLPDAAEKGLDAKIDALLRTLFQAAQIPVADAEIEGRKVASINAEFLYLSWWAEGPHFVLSGNQLGPKPVLRRIAGRGDNLTGTERYARFRAKKSFTIAGEIWVDVPPLVKLIPQAVFPKLPELLDATGLNGLAGVRIAWGYEDEAMRTDYDVFLPAPRKGGFALLDGVDFHPGRLPRLPADADSVQVGCVDFVKAYDALAAMVDSIVQLDPTGEAERIKTQLAKFEQSLEPSLRDSLLAALGSEVVVYSSPADGPFGFMGVSAAVAVKDRARLEAALDRLADGLRAADPAVTIDKKESGGAIYWFGGYRAEFMPVGTTVALSDNWLHLSPLTPAPSLRFMRLQSAGAPAWDPSPAPLPKHSGKVVGVVYSNPRPLVQLVASAIPLAVAAARNTDPDFDFDLTRLPSVDAILDAAFPGAAVFAVDDEGWHIVSRYSLPLTGPELGLSTLGGGSATFGFLGPFLWGAAETVRERAFSLPATIDE